MPCPHSVHFNRRCSNYAAQISIEKQSKDPNLRRQQLTGVQLRDVQYCKKPTPCCSSSSLQILLQIPTALAHINLPNMKTCGEEQFCKIHAMTGSNLALSGSGALTVEGIKDTFTHNICAFLTTSAPRPPLPSSVLVDGRFPLPMIQGYPNGVSKWSVCVHKL